MYLIETVVTSSYAHSQFHYSIVRCSIVQHNSRLTILQRLNSILQCHYHHKQAPDGAVLPLFGLISYAYPCLDWDSNPSAVVWEVSVWTAWATYGPGTVNPSKDESSNLSAIYERSHQHVRIRDNSDTACELVAKRSTYSLLTPLNPGSSPTRGTDMHNVVP